MDTLRVRVYNVRFGDAILVSVPDRAAGGEIVMRHILIDLGNVLTGAGGQDSVFRPVLKDILDVLAGQPLDLYVMTHEHMDHIQGLLYAFNKWTLRLPVRFAWLTASAEKDYYKGHPQADKQRMEMQNAYTAIEHFLQAAPEHETPVIRALMLNNNPRSTDDCVTYLRGLAENTTYVHRDCDLTGKHPFEEARFRIWAPEEDTSAYYRRLLPMALGASTGGEAGPAPALSDPPPRGVDAGAFHDLVEIRRQGYVDNLLAIDRAANNTSVVFSLEWRGRKLLFPGDAERLSWKTMDAGGLLEPVQFLKVSHHGSSTGMPAPKLLEKLLPSGVAGVRQGAVSTHLNTYHDVPDEETLAALSQRLELRSVLDAPDKLYLDFEFTA